MAEEKKETPQAPVTQEDPKVLYRQEKVAALKAAVEAGTYQIAPEATAASLLRYLAQTELERRRRSEVSDRDADLSEGLEVNHPDKTQTGPEE